MSKSAKTPKLPKLPETLFAKYEADPDPYLLAYETEEETVDETDVTEVGEYRLVKTRKLRRKIVVEPAE